MNWFGSMKRVEQPGLFGRPRAGARAAVRELPVVGSRRRGTRFVELPVQSVINPPESTGMGFWSLNPYVGCEFGCTYCYARYSHRYVVERAHDRGALDEAQFGEYRREGDWEAFEHRIFVKRLSAVRSALDADLAKVRQRTHREGTQNIVIGTSTDPYQPAERQYHITREVLKRLTQERGFRIGIISKSPLVTRDIDILKQLALRHQLSVYVSLISVDVRVIKAFEARSPMPHARLRGLRKLTDAGIRAGLIVAPILPGITDSVDQLEQLFAAAKQHGARFVFPSPLRLYPDARRRFLPIVRQHFPALAERYEANYGKEWNAPDEYIKALKRRFHRLAREHGLQSREEDDEQPPPDKEGPAAVQLGLL